MSILSNSRHITLLDKQFQTELDIVIYFKHYSFSLHLLPGLYIRQIASGKRVGAQNEKRLNRDI